MKRQVMSPALPVQRQCLTEAVGPAAQRAWIAQRGEPLRTRSTKRPALARLTSAAPLAPLTTHAAESTIAVPFSGGVPDVRRARKWAIRIVRVVAVSSPCSGRWAVHASAVAVGLITSVRVLAEAIVRQGLSTLCAATIHATR
jgi:hypothetical protein